MLPEPSTIRPTDPTAASAACETGRTIAGPDFHWYWFLLPEAIIGLALTLESGLRLAAEDYNYFVALQRWPGYVIAAMLLCVMVLAVTLRHRIVFPSKRFRLFWLGYDCVILIVFVVVFTATT